MYPQLFKIGNLAVSSYGIMLSLAILTVAITSCRQALRYNFNPNLIREAIVIVVPFGFAGARILFMVQNWHYYRDQNIWKAFIQFDGIAFYGFMFGVVFALYFWSIWRKESYFRNLDFLAPQLALGYAVLRVGCFLNGCCYGKEADVPWALPINMADDVLRHPAQLYAVLGGLLIYFVLRFMYPRKPYDGFIVSALFALYGMMRFIVEFFRYGKPLWLGLTGTQFFSIGLFLVFSALIVYCTYIQKKKQI